MEKSWGFWWLCFRSGWASYIFQPHAPQESAAQLCQLKGEDSLSQVLLKPSPNTFSLGDSLSTTVFFFCCKVNLEDFSSPCPSFLDSRNFLHSSPTLHWGNCLACHVLSRISKMIRIKNGSKLKTWQKYTFFKAWYILWSGIHCIHRKSCISTH